MNKTPQQALEKAVSGLKDSGVSEKFLKSAELFFWLGYTQAMADSVSKLMLNLNKSQATMEELTKTET